MAQNEEKRKFKDDIHKMLNDVKDYKALKKQIVRMYKNWVAEDDATSRRVGQAESTDKHQNFT